jgi:ABC-type branched-subunit amino acid transport system substrate-binding protein
MGEIPYVPSSLVSTLFKKIAQDLCYTTPSPEVFYAGRNSVFDQFISQLEQEGDCAGKHLTIVTGGDADGLPLSATVSNAIGAQVSVIYADIENSANVTTEFKGDFQAWLSKSGDQSMRDPWLLASYDAMTAAASAIAEAEGSTGTPGQLTAGNVAQWIHQLNRSAAVTGATGTFQIGPDGDLESPDTPIVQLAAGKATTLRG